MNNEIPKPHGNILINRIVDERKNIEGTFTLDVSDDQRNDVENIADGIFSPLEGFVNSDDFDTILKTGRLTNGLPWTIPIILDVDELTKNQIKDYKEIVLRNNNELFAILDVEEIFDYDKKNLARSLYGTLDITHPGVSKTNKMNDYLVSGKINLLKKITDNSLRYRRMTPIETRYEIKQKGWKSIVGFQTRNIPHIAHEMLQKAALNIFDGLFINPLIGKKKSGDFKDEVILQSYEQLINNYYPANRVIFVSLHTEMRYAGPKEAIHHAIMRKNFGCSHFIVGRDHAGVGNFYHPFAAHQIFNDYEDLGITPIFFPAFYYCKKCLGYSNERTCPHSIEFHEELSGTRMRKMINSGEIPREHLMRPEISKLILSYKNPFVE